MQSGRLALLAILVAVVAVAAVAGARGRAREAAPIAPAAAPPAPTAPSAAAPSPTPQHQAVPIIAQPRSEEEAAVSRIDALVQAGDIGRARDAADEFLRRYPTSSYCQKIETLTGVHPRPAIPGE
jgi:hypothetical protein